MKARSASSFVFCFLMMASLAQSKGIPYTGKEKVTLINTIETRNCFVSYVKIKGVVYLVKQKKDEKKQLAAVRDALAAYIARDLGIAHRVEIIAFDKKFPGKINSLWPATLHTLASGETIRAQLDCKYNELRLRQFWAKAENFSEKGLTRNIIAHMTWHKQLATIVALDLITGNSDRHGANLFFNPKTNKFCAIDMDDTFNKNLCEFACLKLEYMIQEENVQFTKEEILALQRMRDVLKFLVRKHKPKDLIAKLHVFARRAGFIKDSMIYTESVAKKLLHYELMIIESFASAKKLIAFLDKVIAYNSI